MENELYRWSDDISLQITRLSGIRTTAVMLDYERIYLLHQTILMIVLRSTFISSPL